ncbi:J domain-containing protein, partial [Haematococcus lacustris]
DKAAQSETKQVEAGGSGAEPVDAEELLKAFFGELKDVDRDNEVNRILWAFKLNPFEKLNLRFDAPIEDVRKQYRKLSLMVHPDKCKHPQATAAFDQDVLKAWRKETKHDNLVRVASFLNDAGKEGVQAAWEKTDEFHERWRLKGRELLASAEWRKRRLGKRMKEETARLEGVAAESRDKAKKTKAVEKEWEATREQRVGTWREFMADASKSGSQ